MSDFIESFTVAPSTDAPLTPQYEVVSFALSEVLKPIEERQYFQVQRSGISFGFNCDLPRWEIRYRCNELLHQWTNPATRKRSGQYLWFVQDDLNWSVIFSHNNEESIFTIDASTASIKLKCESESLTFYSEFCGKLEQAQTGKIYVPPERNEPVVTNDQIDEMLQWLDFTPLEGEPEELRNRSVNLGIIFELIKSISHESISPEQYKLTCWKICAKGFVGFINNILQTENPENHNVRKAIFALRILYGFCKPDLKERQIISRKLAMLSQPVVGCLGNNYLKIAITQLAAADLWDRVSPDFALISLK
jgi:hypothetical protein